VTRVGFLGPHGTFAEEAVLTQPDLADQELRPLRSVPDVISAVERDEADIGLVPIENSIEGTVSVTLDTLAFDTDLLIQREIDLPISLSLCALPGTKLDEIRTVLSHPNPLGQSRVWLAGKLPDARDLTISTLVGPAFTGFSNETLLFDDEGHGIRKPKNLRVLYARLIDFFAASFSDSGR